MTIIYNNIAANTAPVVDHVLTGCENQVLFRADSWGATTIVQVDSYSSSDPTQKIWTAFLTVAGGNDYNWCPPCLSKGEVYRFSVINPDPLTTQLFVEILEPGCCCGSSPQPCFDIPIQFVPCS